MVSKTITIYNQTLNTTDSAAKAVKLVVNGRIVSNNNNKVIVRVGSRIGFILWGIQTKRYINIIPLKLEFVYARFSPFRITVSYDRGIPSIMTASGAILVERRISKVLEELSSLNVAH